MLDLLNYNYPESKPSGIINDNSTTVDTKWNWHVMKLHLKDARKQSALTGPYRSDT